MAPQPAALLDDLALEIPPADPYLSLPALSAHAGLSVRALRRRFRDPICPLPHYRVEGLILVRRSEYEAWRALTAPLDDAGIDALVARIAAKWGITVTPVEPSRRRRPYEELEPEASKSEPAPVVVPLDPYLSLRALAAYSGISVRSLRRLLQDVHHPMPHYRAGGKIVVRRSEFDTWIAPSRVGERKIDALVERAFRELRAK